MSSLQKVPVVLKRRARVLKERAVKQENAHAQETAAQRQAAIAWMQKAAQTATVRNTNY